MKSLLFNTNTPLSEPVTCSITRNVKVLKFRHRQNLYTATVKTDICIEDPYIGFVRGVANAIQTGNEEAIREVERDLKDVLIKTNIVI